MDITLELPECMAIPVRARISMVALVPVPLLLPVLPPQRFGEDLAPGTIPPGAILTGAIAELSTAIVVCDIGTGTLGLTAGLFVLLSVGFGMFMSETGIIQE